MHFFERMSQLISEAATLAVSESLVASPAPDLSNDQLVNHTWQHFTDLAAIVLVVCLVAVVGVVSRRVEHVIGAAFIASLVLISLFFVVVR